MTPSLITVLEDLGVLVRQVTPDQHPLPTPCPDYDVAALREHILSWLPVFATALAEPDGEERPDPAAYRAPSDPEAAAEQVRSVIDVVDRALAGGVESGKIRFIGSTLPAPMVVGMFSGEVITHGWDLARATGLPWQPPDDVVADALQTFGGMLTPEYRGPDKSFGEVVPVPDDAPVLERLIGFVGRDPRWTPPTGG